MPGTLVSKSSLFSVLRKEAVVSLPLTIPCVMEYIEVHSNSRSTSLEMFGDIPVLKLQYSVYLCGTVSGCKYWVLTVASAISKHDQKSDSPKVRRRKNNAQS